MALKKLFVGSHRLVEEAHTSALTIPKWMRKKNVNLVFVGRARLFLQKDEAGRAAWAFLQSPEPSPPAAAAPAPPRSRGPREQKPREWRRAETYSSLLETHQMSSKLETGLIFFLKREDFSTVLCLEANLRTEKGWGPPAFAPVSFWWSKQEEAPRRGDLLPSQHCLATLARKNTAWSFCLPTWTRCKTSSLGS